ncbi:MAG: OadG-related small transporter subunit [Desulfobacteraceae bacterium]|jgi:hypothetical protein|nr:OadG-related small transporter subunit [Desulfobacteraceae bacterium]
MPSMSFDPMTYGCLLTLVGMGGTLASLWLLAVVMVVLKRLLPPGGSETPPPAKGSS